MNLLELLAANERSALRRSLSGVARGELNVYRATHQIDGVAGVNAWIDLSLALHRPGARRDPVILAQLNDVTAHHVAERGSASSPSTMR